MTSCATGPIDAVLMIGFGGPERPEEVLPFLRRVAHGRGLPDERLAEAASRYEAVGGLSPYNDLTRQQAEALSSWLAGQRMPLPVHVGMRNSHPFIHETVMKMTRQGRRHAVGVILAAHRAEASWQRYMQDVDRAIQVGGAGLFVTYLDPWFQEPGFLEASAQRIEQAAGCRRGAWPRDLPVVFTAHSIPLEMADRSPYVEDLIASCRGVVQILGIEAWCLAYQSRSGDPSTPWLEPDIGQALRRIAQAGSTEVVVHAIGFLSDHVEVLYDLDVEAKQIAEDLGMTYRRAPCVNAHPEFIAMLGSRVGRLASGSC